MQKRSAVGLSLILTAAVLWVAGGDLLGQVKKGKERAALTKQIMGGLVQPNCAALGKGLKEEKIEDEAWAKLATNAALLNEAGYLLMDDGRCPDADWANATKTLRECSAVLLKAIESKDAKAGQGAFEAMTKACAACHKAHKK